ncbi:MAG: ABC transporter permease [Planctomycetota bacterium]|jgi:ABC-type transport system involved in multi-copper enzyme maturation permease subunit
MNFLEQLWAIARNTAVECVRQPVSLAVLVAGTLLIVLSVPFSGFTLMDDQRMFVDLALSTVFVCGTLLAAFLATNALSREIDNRTALTVVSKPVARPVFVWGKYLGVAAALTACTAFLALVLMLVEMHGTMPTMATPYHFPVLAFGVSAIVATFACAIWTNYFYGWSFPASVLGFGIPLLGLGYLGALLFDKDWTPLSPAAQFEGGIWTAIGMMWLGLCVLASIAVAASTRFGQVVTLGITFGAFMAGLMSDWLIARPLRDITGMMERMAKDGTAASAADGAAAKRALLEAAYAAVPNFQVFWLSDAVQQKRDIPFSYVAPSAAYGLALIVAALCVAVAMFERREVG